MRLSELFYSIQGEGKLSGVPSTFVRSSGCNLRCGWCFAPDTPVLRPDWSWTPVGDLRVGDAVLARTHPRDGRHGGLAATVVRQASRRDADLVRLDGGLTCTPDHPFWLSGKGGARSGWRAASRCVGLPTTYLAESPGGGGDPQGGDGDDYRLGYLAGMADGDGTFWTLKHRRGYRRFRLALNDQGLLDRFADYAGRAGVALRPGIHAHAGFNGPGTQPTLWLTTDGPARALEARLAEDRPGESWAWGYVGGMIDAEGSLGGRALRISQNPEANGPTDERIGRALGRLGLGHTREPDGFYLHSSGGQLWRVLARARPSKRSVLEGVLGRAPNGSRRIEEVSPAGRGEVTTLTTDCGSFIAGGHVVKNCDTPYASWHPEGGDVPVPEIVARVGEYGARHVVFTGGEPLIMPDAEALCLALQKAGHHVTVETAGTVYKPLAIDLASVSPKLSNSTPTDREGGRFALAHDRQRLRPDVIQRFIDGSPDFQLKFVVSASEDLAEVDALLSRLSGWTPADVLLMPEGRDAAILAERTAWLADLCKERGNRLCPRLHVALYGDTRAT